MLILNGTQTIAAAGSDQAGATSISGTYAAAGGTLVKVTGADGTKGVKMPALGGLTIGTVYFICNTDGSNNLEVYPATGDKINPAADNVGITVAANTILFCIVFDADQWFGSELPVIAA